MMDTSDTIYDVVIAGAGPVGLFLACELRLFNLSVLLLEQHKDPDSTFKKLPFGMRGLTVPTVEALHRRGLLDEIIKDNHASIASLGLQPGLQAGHFAGIQFYLKDIDTAKWDYRLAVPAHSNVVVELERLESTLAERAIAAGVGMRRGVCVEGIEQSVDGVTVHSGIQTFSARWLVGCDGGRSTVRKVAGFEFVGTDPELTAYSALVELAGNDRLSPGKHNTSRGMYSLAPTSHLVMADFDGGALHRESVTLEHLQAVLRRVSNTDVSLAAVHAVTTWTDRSAQATSYRKGRVLLAGDAAHIHSPLGGQGLNLGVGDAVNLGWKLAATAHGWAPDGLLDTYFSERHPIGAEVLDWSRAQVLVMGPRQASRALEAVMRDIIATRDGTTYFAERVMGVMLRHDLGGRHNHSLVGRSVPDFEFVETKEKVGVLLRRGRGLLLDFSSDAAIRATGARWSHRVDYVDGSVKEDLGLGALLVRPDGVVAWASDGLVDIDEVEIALSHWFGAATTLGV